MPTNPYRRIRGAGLGWVRYSQLWIAPDHLLLVRATGLTESYRRFYFRDIQAMTLRRTRMRTVWSVVWGILALVCLGAMGLMFVVKDTADAAVWLFFVSAFGGAAACCVVGLLINLALGPTCAVHVQTQVQTQRIGSLSRERRARRVIAEVKEAVTQAAASGEAP